MRDLSWENKTGFISYGEGFSRELKISQWFQAIAKYSAETAKVFSIHTDKSYVGQERHTKGSTTMKTLMIIASLVLLQGCGAVGDLADSIDRASARKSTTNTDTTTAEGSTTTTTTVSKSKASSSVTTTTVPSKGSNADQTPEEAVLGVWKTACESGVIYKKAFDGKLETNTVSFYKDSDCENLNQEVAQRLSYKMDEENITFTSKDSGEVMKQSYVIQDNTMVFGTADTKDYNENQVYLKEIK